MTNTELIAGTVTVVAPPRTTRAGNRRSSFSQLGAAYMDTSLAVEIDGLVKRFGATRALDELDLAVPRRSIYGVLGPNGAGKTTAIRVLTTLLRPDGGRASVLGHDVVREAEAVRARISLTGQYASVDEDLSGRE